VKTNLQNTRTVSKRKNSVRLPELGHFLRKAAADSDEMVEAEVVLFTAEDGNPYAHREFAQVRLPQSLVPSDFADGQGGVDVFRIVAHSPAFLAKQAEQDKQNEIDLELRRKYPKLELIRLLGSAHKNVQKEILRCRGAAAVCEGALSELEQAYRDLLEYEEGENDRGVTTRRPPNSNDAAEAENTSDTDEGESDRSVVKRRPSSSNTKANADSPLETDKAPEASPKIDFAGSKLTDDDPSPTHQEPVWSWSSHVPTTAILEAEMQPGQKIPVFVGYRPTMEIRLAYFPKSMFPAQFSVRELYCVGDPYSIELGEGLVAYSVPYVENKIQNGMEGWWIEQGRPLRDQLADAHLILDAHRRKSLSAAQPAATPATEELILWSDAPIG
jgi:hypothetical protein